MKPYDWHGHDSPDRLTEYAVLLRPAGPRWTGDTEPRLELTADVVARTAGGRVRNLDDRDPYDALRAWSAEITGRAAVDDSPAHPWTTPPEYRRPYHLQPSQVYEMARAMHAYERRAEAITARSGYPGTAGAALAQILEALGIAVVLTPDDPQRGSTYDDNTYTARTPGQAAAYVDRTFADYIRAQRAGSPA